MRSIKLLGLALALSLIAAAVIGAASASASVLCKENTPTCAAGSIYPSGTAVSGALEAGKVLTIMTAIGNIDCSSSSISGKTTAEKGAPLPIEISSLSVSSCTGPCKGAEVRNLPYLAGAERTTGGNGTVSVGSGGKGNPSLKFTECAAFGLKFTCVWGASQLNYTLEGGSSPSLQINTNLFREEVEGGSKFCPESVALKSTKYPLSSPKPVYAGAGAGIGKTVICKESAAVCPSKSATYPSGTTIGAEAVPQFKWGWGATQCSSSMALESTAESGAPLPLKMTSLTFSGCEGDCKAVTGESEITSFEATGGGNGKMKTYPYIRMTGCLESVYGTPLTCEYRNENIYLPVTGGAAGKAKIDMGVVLGRVTGKGGSLLCPETVTFSGTSYYVTTPNPLWLTKEEL